MTGPSVQLAVKITQQGRIEAIASAIPKLRADEVLIRVACIAITPADGKTADLSPSIGATVGFDYSGEIVALGTLAVETSKRLAIGDRVFGCVFGNNPERLENGAFAEFVAAHADLVLLIPSKMSFEATLVVGLATVGMALYHSFKLPMPRDPNSSTPVLGPCDFVLVYGGSTAIGLLAIQMIRRSGLIPIATCSPHNSDFVKSLGAATTFDYHSPTCGDQILEFTKNKLAYALDCITDTTSMRICYEAIGSAGGQYLSLDPFPIRGHTRRRVKPEWNLTLTMFNQPVSWKRPFQRDARPRDREFTRNWFQLAQKLLDADQIKPHPFQVRTGGLQNVCDGIEAVWKGEIRGKKLVYPIGGCQ